MGPCNPDRKQTCRSVSPTAPLQSIFQHTYLLRVDRVVKSLPKHILRIHHHHHHHHNNKTVPVLSLCRILMIWSIDNISPLPELIKNRSGEGTVSVCLILNRDRNGSAMWCGALRANFLQCGALWCSRQGSGCGYTTLLRALIFEAPSYVTRLVIG